MPTREVDTTGWLHGTAGRILQANGVEICAETFGEVADPTILLLGGVGSSLDWWEEDFCARLAGAGRFVIRYDHRDTGRSVHYPVGETPYTLTDLADDALGLLDALGVGRAHLVGLSMGGWLSQLIALDHPARVASLTLIATTSAAGFSDAETDLPGMTPALGEAFAAMPEPPDWSDREAAIAYIVATERPLAGTHPFDEATKRAIAARVVARTADLAASATNPYNIAPSARWRERLGTIAAPTLVLHGTADALFPPGNGEALAREIPGARLQLLDGMGHEYPPRPLWDTVIPAIVAHTAG